MKAYTERFTTDKFCLVADGMPIISIALDNVISDSYCYGDTEVLDEMEAMLIAAGAKISEPDTNEE